MEINSDNEILNIYPKPLEEEDLLITVRLTSENKLLREQVETLLEENKSLKEKFTIISEENRRFREEMENLPGLPEDIMEMFRMADSELQEKNNDISQLHKKMEAWSNHAKEIEKRLSNEIRKSWWNKLIE
jgi:septation ring formation regulator EzrA